MVSRSGVASNISSCFSTRRWKRIIKIFVLVWVLMVYVWFSKIHGAAEGPSTTPSKPSSLGNENANDASAVARSGQAKPHHFVDVEKGNAKVPLSSPQPQQKGTSSDSENKNIGHDDNSSPTDPIPASERLWPPDDKRTAPTWIFLYCASRTKNVLRISSESGVMRMLMELSHELDFRVLACDPMHDDADTAVLHERLHYLPAETRSKLYDEAAAGVFKVPRSREQIRRGADGSVVLGEGLGMHAVLLDVLNRIECRYFLLMSPNVNIGRDTAAIRKTLRAMLSYPHPTDQFDERVFVPRILLQPEEDDDASLSAAAVAAAAGLPPSLKILSHGLMVSEVQGGLATFYPRLAGMHALDDRGAPPQVEADGSSADGSELPRVDLPTGLIALFSFKTLRDRVHDVVLLKNAANEDSYEEKLLRMQRRNVGHPLQRYATERTFEFQCDVALAMLHFADVRAMPVIVTYVANAGLEYTEELAAAAAGGFGPSNGKKHSSNPNEAVAAVDALIPRVLSAGAFFRHIIASRHHLRPLASEVTLYWDTYCSCTGINIEAINFLVPLGERMAVRAVANPDCWCPGFPQCDRSALVRLMAPKLGSGVEWFGPKGVSSDVGATIAPSPQNFFDTSKKTIWVTHKPVDAFPTFPYHGAIDFTKRPTYIVGRTMIEIDRISDQWVRTLNNDMLVDEIWVPSQFLVDAFYDSGVKAEKKIFVIPEAIDVHLYDPKHYHGPVAAAIAAGANHKGNNERSGAAVHANLDAYSSESDEGRAVKRFVDAENRKRRRPPHPEFGVLCPECFRFFTNFKWERRKGWDILLSAYFSTFTADDKVILFIKTYLYMDPRPRDVNRITNKIHEYARQMGKDVKRLPRFVILAEETEASKMPEIYAQMDCFVLPTRGEGWGLPMQEAMAMGLPTIATKWGGNLEFMTEQNSLLLEIDGLETAEQGFGGIRYPHLDDLSEAASKDRYRDEELAISEKMTKEERSRVPGRRGKKHRTLTPEEQQRPPRWAKPSLKHLKKLMEWVVDNPDKAAAIGREGRRTIIKNFSREAVTDVVLKRLDQIRIEDPRFQSRQ